MSDTPDTDLKLIKAIESRPFLYDKSKGPQNEAYIKKTWTQISQELKLPSKYTFSFIIVSVVTVELSSHTNLFSI